MSTARRTENCWGWVVLDGDEYTGNNVVVVVVVVL